MSTYSAFDGVAVDGSRGSPIGDWLKSSGTGVAAAILLRTLSVRLMFSTTLRTFFGPR